MSAAAESPRALILPPAETALAPIREAATCPIVVAAQEESAVEALGSLKTILGVIERRREELKRPHLEAGREIDAEAKRIAEPLARLESAIKGHIATWRRREAERIAAEQRRIAEENERRRREAEDRARQEAARIEAENRRRREEAERLEREAREAAAAKALEEARAAGFSETEAAEIGEWEAQSAAEAIPEPEILAAPVAPPVLLEVAPAPLARTTATAFGRVTVTQAWEPEVVDLRELCRYVYESGRTSLVAPVLSEIRSLRPGPEHQPETIPGVKWTLRDRVTARGL